MNSRRGTYTTRGKVTEALGHGGGSQAGNGEQNGLHFE